MRGKDDIYWMAYHKVRITPAHAGKSISPAGLKGKHKDHPRTCGEKAKFLHHIDKKRGSPPHMRGKADFRTTSTRSVRITPAHAGKRSFSDFSRLSAEDHPRTCGEKFRGYVNAHARAGSPPHMRGKAVTSCPFTL